MHSAPTASISSGRSPSVVGSAEIADRRDRALRVPVRAGHRRPSCADRDVSAFGANGETACRSRRPLHRLVIRTAATTVHRNMLGVHTNYSFFQGNREIVRQPVCLIFAESGAAGKQIRDRTPRVRPRGPVSPQKTGVQSDTPWQNRCGPAYLGSYTSSDPAGPAFGSPSAPGLDRSAPPKGSCSAAIRVRCPRGVRNSVRRFGERTSPSVKKTVAHHYRDRIQVRRAATATVTYGIVKLPPSSSIARPTPVRISASRPGSSWVNRPVVGNWSSHSSRL